MLGSGGRETVYHARDRVLDEIVALKALKALKRDPRLARSNRAAENCITVGEERHRRLRALGTRARLGAQEELTQNGDVLVVAIGDRVMVQGPARLLGPWELRKAIERTHAAAEYTRAVTDLVLDPARSRVRIHTYAEGLFARLAHDLELTCGGLSGRATAAAGGRTDAGSATIEAPLRGLAVAGVVGRDGRVDDRGLNPTERRDCIAKMYTDVFHARPDAMVLVQVQRDGASARVRIVPPNGKAVEVVIAPEVVPDGGGLRASGSFEVSLVAIGSDVVKGPMGAFRVKDLVKVSFDVVFAPAQPA